MEYRNAEFKCYRKALKVSIVAASAGNTGRFRPSARSLSGPVVHRHAGKCPGTGAASSRAPARIPARMPGEFASRGRPSRGRLRASRRAGPNGKRWRRLRGCAGGRGLPAVPSRRGPGPVARHRGRRGTPPACAGRKPTRISGNRRFDRRGYSVVESGAGCWRLAGRLTACEPPSGTESTSKTTTTDSPSQSPRPTAYHRPAAAGRSLPGPRARGDASSARPLKPLLTEYEQVPA